MAREATAVRFRVELSHVDRGVYESLDVRTALHPSEKPERLVLRLLAFVLLHEPGLAFSRGGLSDADEPPLSVQVPGGACRLWVEVGHPAVERLHRASKASQRVVVVTRGVPRQLLAELTSARVHRSEALELLAVEAPLVDAIAARLGPRGADLELTVNEQVAYVTLAGETLSGTVTPFRGDGTAPAG